MPKGRATPPTPVDLQEQLNRLHVMHQAAEDAHLDMWPDPEDVLGVLAYARLHHRALPPGGDGQPQRAEQAAVRIAIVRALKAMVLDRELGAAIDDARAAGTTWAALAPLLGVERPGSAKNQRDRLRGAEGDPQRRRTPEAGRAVVVRKLRERENQGRADAAVARRQRELLRVARAVVTHAEELAVSEECAEDWLSLAGVRQCLAIERPRVSDYKRLANCLGITVHEILSYAASEGIPAARTEEARAALDEAVRLRDQLHQEYGQED